MSQIFHPFNKLILIFSIALCIACSSKPAAIISQPPSELTPLTAAKEIARKTFAKESFPGMAVMVMSQGEVVMSEAYGYADVEMQKEIDPYSSLFRIGSVSKPVTAAGLALLHEQGKIDLDVIIQEYVPEFPKKQYDVNLRQLAGHLAGIRHYKGFEFMSNKHYPDVRSGLKIFANDTLIHEPGSKYAYSSYGWNLISAAMETVAKEDFLSYMQTHVFDFLGLKDMRAEFDSERGTDNVQYYIKDFDKTKIARQVDNSYKWAGGGFISSAHDVALFAQAHLEGRIMKKETFKEWTETQQDNSGKQTNYGIGWRTGEDKKSRNWVGHSGGSVGGTTMMLVYPEEELIVVTLVNLSSAKTGDLAFRIANQFLTQEASID